MYAWYYEGREEKYIYPFLTTCIKSSSSWPPRKTKTVQETGRRREEESTMASLDPQMDRWLTSCKFRHRQQSADDWGCRGVGTTARLRDNNLWETPRGFHCDKYERCWEREIHLSSCPGIASMKMKRERILHICVLKYLYHTSKQKMN